MKKSVNAGIALGIIAIALFVFHSITSSSNQMSGAPPIGIPESQVPQDLDPFAWLRNWQRPDGPAKVGIQVGHWQNQDAPDELKRLRNNNGASAGGVTELEINMTIATQIKAQLESVGVQVDLLPVTIPPGYWADIFITIHADGNQDPSVRGFKFAGPWRDFTGKSTGLVSALNQDYSAVTGLPYDPNISRNMRGYYAFSWWRFEHAIHPMTTAVIAETGFVTNPIDREFLTSQPQLVATTIATTLEDHLREQQLL